MQFYPSTINEIIDSSLLLIQQQFIRRNITVKPPLCTENPSVMCAQSTGTSDHQFDEQRATLFKANVNSIQIWWDRLRYPHNLRQTKSSSVFVTMNRNRCRRGKEAVRSILFNERSRQRDWIGINYQLRHYSRAQWHHGDELINR